MATPKRTAKSKPKRVAKSHSSLKVQLKPTPTPTTSPTSASNNRLERVLAAARAASHDRLERVLAAARAAIGLPGAPDDLGASVLRSVERLCGITPPADLVLAWTWLTEPSDPQSMESFSPEGMIGATDYIAMHAGHDRYVAVMNHGSQSEFLCLAPAIVEQLRRGQPVETTRFVEINVGDGDRDRQGPAHDVTEWVAWNYLGGDAWVPLGVRPPPVLDDD